MKKIKALFVDFDWTIYDHTNKKIPDSTIKALLKAKENGVKIFINSARTYYSLKGMKILDLVPFDGYGVINGMATFLNDQLLKAHYLSHDDVMDLIKVATANNLSFLVSTLDNTYLNKVKNDQYVKDFYQDFKEPIPNDFKDYDFSSPLIAIQIFYKDTNDYLFESFKHKVKVSRFYHSNVEFNKEVTTKGETIKLIKKHYKFKKSECMAIGDDLNDISMFKQVKYSVCMGNGHLKTKRHAKYVTDPIDKDGLYNALKHFKII